MTDHSWVDLMRPERWPTFALLSARVTGLMLVAPGLASAAIPFTVRGAVAVTMTIFVLQATPAVTVPESVIALPLTLLGELLIGLAIGLAAGIFIHGVTVAGEVVSVQMGLAIAETFDPATAMSGSAIAQLTNFFALTIYLVLGGHVLLIHGLMDSVYAVPPGTFGGLAAGGRALLPIVGSLFVTAVQIAAPILVALLLTSVGLAILGKAVPQMNILMVSFPITIGIGLVVLGASLTFRTTLTVRWVESVPDLIRAVIGALIPAPVGS